MKEGKLTKKKIPSPRRRRTPEKKDDNSMEKE